MTSSLISSQGSFKQPTLLKGSQVFAFLTLSVFDLCVAPAARLGTTIFGYAYTAMLLAVPR